MGNEKYIANRYVVFIDIIHRSLLESKSNRANDGIQDFNPPSVLPGSATSSPATALPSSSSIQYAVFCSSKEARVRPVYSFIWNEFIVFFFFLLSSQVIALPSQVCLFKQKIFESLGTSASNITRASVVKIAG